MSNGEADIIGTIPSAKGCTAHAAIVESLKHGDKKFSAVGEDVAEIKRLLESKHGEITTIKFGPLQVKSTHAEWAFRFALIVIGMYLFYMGYTKLSENQMSLERSRMEMRQEMMKLHNSTVTMRGDRDKPE